MHPRGRPAAIVAATAVTGLLGAGGAPAQPTPSTPSGGIGRGAWRRGSGTDGDGARRRAVFGLASAVLLLAACAQVPGRLERATAPVHATGDVPIAGPVVGGDAAEAHGGHEGHAQGRASAGPRTR